MRCYVVFGGIFVPTSYSWGGEDVVHGGDNTIYCVENLELVWSSL